MQEQGYVCMIMHTSKKLASDFLLSTAAYEAVRKNVQVYGHESPSDEDLLVDDEEETENPSALLQKFRNENNCKEKDEEELESLLLKSKDKEEEIHIKIKFGKKIYRQVFKNHYSEKGKLFLPNRIANNIDSEDEHADSDIPITLLRRKAGWSKFGISNNIDY
ncbi:hypothetical protein NPIL_430631 [Nephila pilipes]|uniref:RED-like N-terminal domain-containing protein n=2 Tax=Nephila pilipes TaxID=299642 RepID=A0A8X6MX77_NEPPI|nr:hypothetical protein NPIL_430631 [Nephila pilipes]